MFKRSLVVIGSVGALGGGALYVYRHRHNHEYGLTWMEGSPLQYQRGQPPFVAPSRAEQLTAVKSGKEFDILVIGGGATGTGIALDAATRGLKVALVEKDDFSSGTSSRSTKLLHGGIRYLEKAFWNLDYEQYKMVREALHERANLIKIAPHLAHPLPIMLPIYNWWKVPYFWVGTKAYDFVAGTKKLESSYYLSATKALEQFPMLKKEKLVGAIVYYDGQHDDSRMNVALALTAAAWGANILNHVEVLQLLHTKTGTQPDGTEKSSVSGAVVRDTLTGEKWEIKAKTVINATGPYTDIIRKMDDPNVEKLVAPSAGVHIILPDYYSPAYMGLIDPSTSDGRVIFFLPWENGTIAGTTDSPTDVVDHPVPREEDISWILNEIRNYLSPDVKIRRGDVLAAWSGIRPLIRDPTKKNTESLVRNHIVMVSEKNLITIGGGKWTTYRQMALEAVDEAIGIGKLNPAQESQTEKAMLVGSHHYNHTMYIKLIQHFGLEKKVAEHLASTYGDRAPDVAILAKPTNKRWPVVGPRLHEMYPYIEAEIIYSIRNEYACTALDMIARRFRIAFLNSNAALEILPRVVDVMATELKWSRSRKNAEFEEAKKFLLSMGLENTKPSIFNAQELIYFYEQFSSLDSNHDGRISLDDFREVLRQNNIEYDENKLRKFMSEVDTNKDGVITIGEYLELMTLVRKGKTKEPAFLSEVQSKQKAKLSIYRSGGGV